MSQDTLRSVLTPNLDEVKMIRQKGNILSQVVWLSLQNQIIIMIKKKLV